MVGGPAKLVGPTRLVVPAKLVEQQKTKRKKKLEWQDLLVPEHELSHFGQTIFFENETAF